MTAPPFTHFGRYRILEELGRGSMGIVYRAEDESLQRHVAIKAMASPADPAERAQYEARFRQEAKAAGGLNHPAIITIHDLGREGDWLYIAMELLQGVELRDLMVQGRLPLPMALDVAAQVAGGLAVAHECGIVHRDIKPSNIMVLAGDRAKIMDFGIARMQSSEVKTQTGLMLGSPKYMSPEQVSGRTIDRRCDIFSMGAMLYEMTAGVPPFTADSLGGLLHEIIHTTPTPPSQVNAAVPPLMDRIVAKAMQKDPGARSQDPRELAHDLEMCRSQLGGAGPAALTATAATGASATAFAATLANHPRVPAAALSLRPSRHFDSEVALKRVADGIAPLRPVRDLRQPAWALAFAGAVIAAVLIAVA